MNRDVRRITMWVIVTLTAVYFMFHDWIPPHPPRFSLPGCLR